MGNDEVALLCYVYPKDAANEKRVLELLRKGAREYYRKPEAKCTTWSYFTPFQPPKSDAQRVIGGVEIYTSKSALQAQADDPVHFQAYHETVKKEDLYSKDESLVAWYQAVGFIARKEHATTFGGNLISQTKFVCKDREAVLKILDDFVPFVRDQEPFILTYTAFTRPKAPKEILLFVRYKDSKGMKSHSKAPKHVDVVKKIIKQVENDMATSTTVWQEIEDSFVSTQVGGPSSSAKL